MPTIKVVGMDKVLRELSEYEKKSDEVIKKAVYAGAKMVADRMKVNLSAVVRKGENSPTVQSMGIPEMQLKPDWQWDTRIGFDGYDEDGMPNIFKARLLENGNSRWEGTHFSKRTVQEMRAPARREMKRIIEEGLKELDRG